MSTTVRAVTLADAEALVAVDREVLAAGDGMVRGAHEVPSVSEIRARIERYRSGERSGPGGYMAVVAMDGRIVGEGTIYRYGPALLRQVAVVALQIRPEAQGHGAGRTLLRALLAWAAENGIVRTELAVRADNERAIGLYRWEGFVEEGRRIALVRLPGGAFVDDFLMARLDLPVRRRTAVSLLLRRDRGRPELLVFRHPSQGVQLPKGTIAIGEAPDAAVLRELREETGIDGARVVAEVPPWSQPMPSGGMSRPVDRWHAFLLEADGPLPDRWAHPARGSPDEEGLVFACGWQALDAPIPVEMHPCFREAVHRARLAERHRRRAPARPRA